MRERRRVVTIGLLLTIGWTGFCAIQPIHLSSQGHEKPKNEDSCTQQADQETRTEAGAGAPANCQSMGPLAVSKMGGTEPRSDVRRLWVSVTDRKGDPVMNLSAKSFRILENKQEQEVVDVRLPVESLAVVLLVEFSRPFAHLYDNVVGPALEFVKQLSPDDCAAVIAYGEKPEVRTDFTRDPSRLRSALESLRQLPAREEVDLFGSLDEVLKRMQYLTGRKALVLSGSGLDSQKRKSLDTVLRRLQDAETVVYAIGKGQFIKSLFELRNLLSQEENLQLLQAENTLKSLSRRSGGKAFLPFTHFADAELAAEIRADLRSQYQLTYRPRGKVGQFRKIQGQLVDSAGIEFPNLKIRVQDGYFANR